MSFSFSTEHRTRIEEFRRNHRTGILVLLFTDMAGSTQLKQDMGDRRAVAIIQQHHAIIRHVLAGFTESREIDTAGDSFFIAFVKASDAVKFSLLVQSAIRAFAGEIKVAISDRIGIHAGEVFVEDRPGSAEPIDLFGIQVDSCARVMSLAEPEQILMTRFVFDNARQLLKGEELAGIGQLSWLNHGNYLMKGVEEPLEICEVGEAGLAVLAQPPDSEKARRHVAPDQEPVLGWRPALGQTIPGTKWTLEVKLGEGGFGEVWKARHQNLKEYRVYKFCFRADRVRGLKREVTLFRLLKERVGEHPNIVGIQDVYFDEPPFYIVMDYVEGEDLARWMEKQGGLAKIPLETRLEIVAQMADALQAAHQAGVIHRDVKPSNILVSRSESGVVRAKLTDFGIGQVVSAEVLAGVTQLGFTQTNSGHDSGTPLYMAPELFSGKPASTRSDIYSLGVVLYQLAVGDFSRPATADWTREINDPLLCEDLAKCLAGNPQERFAGAQELAQHLRALPERRLELSRQQAQIAARERSAYRTGLIRAGLGALAVILVIVALALYAFRESRIAKSQARQTEAALTDALNQKREAERQSKIAQNMSGFLTGMFDSIDPAQAKLHEPTVREILDVASGKIGTAFSNEPLTELPLQAAICEIYLKLAKYDQALPHAEEAMNLALKGFGNKDDKNVAEARGNLAFVLKSLGQPNEALTNYDEALVMMKRLGEEHDPDFGDILNNEAQCLVALGRPDEALPKLEAAREIRQKGYPGDSPQVAESLNNIGLCLLILNHPSDALPKLQESLAMYQRISHGEDSRVVARGLINLGGNMKDLGHLDEALTNYQKGLAMYQRIYKEDFPEIAASMYNIGNCLVDLYREKEALPALEAALAMRQRIYKTDNADVAQSLASVASCLYFLGRMTEADVKARETIAMYQRLIMAEPGNNSLKMNLARMQKRLGDLLAKTGKADEANQSYQNSLQTLDTLLAADAANARAKKLRLNLRILLGLQKVEVVISSTSHEGQAQRIGLQKGDVLVRYAGQPITFSDQLTTSIGDTKGSAIELEIHRDGKPLKFTVTEGPLGITTEDRSVPDKGKPATSR